MRDVVRVCVCSALHVHVVTSSMLISLCHSCCAIEAPAGPSKECSEAKAEQPSQTKSESETQPGTP